METKRLKRLPVGIPYLSTSMTPRCDYIERLANANKWTNEETVRQLAKQYDGYHFTWPSPDIFNPFSLLNAFARNRINNYWFASGTLSTQCKDSNKVLTNKILTKNFITFLLYLLVFLYSKFNI